MSLHLDPEFPAPDGGLYADRPLYLDAQRERVLEEGDPEAAFVLIGVRGGTIDGSEVKRLGLSLVDGRVVQQGHAGASEKPAAKARKGKPEPDKAEE